MGRVSRRDLKLLARNSAAALEQQNQRGHSLAVCFDALVAVLDEALLGVEGCRISDKLKRELDKRRAK